MSGVVGSSSRPAVPSTPKTSPLASSSRTSTAAGSAGIGTTVTAPYGSRPSTSASVAAATQLTTREQNLRRNVIATRPPTTAGNQQTQQQLQNNGAAAAAANAAAAAAAASNVVRTTTVRLHSGALRSQTRVRETDPAFLMPTAAPTSTSSPLLQPQSIPLPLPVPLGPVLTSTTATFSVADAVPFGSTLARREMEARVEDERARRQQRADEARRRAIAQASFGADPAEMAAAAEREATVAAADAAVPASSPGGQQQQQSGTPAASENGTLIAPLSHAAESLDPSTLLVRTRSGLDLLDFESVQQKLLSFVEGSPVHDLFRETLSSFFRQVFEHFLTVDAAKRETASVEARASALQQAALEIERELRLMKSQASKLELQVETQAGQLSRRTSELVAAREKFYAQLLLIREVVQQHGIHPDLLVDYMSADIASADARLLAGEKAREVQQENYNKVALVMDARTQSLLGALKSGVFGLMQQLQKKLDRCNTKIRTLDVFLSKARYKARKQNMVWELLLAGELTPERCAEIASRHRAEEAAAAAERLARQGEEEDLAAERRAKELDEKQRHAAAAGPHGSKREEGDWQELAETHPHGFAMLQALQARHAAQWERMERQARDGDCELMDEEDMKEHLDTVFRDAALVPQSGPSTGRGGLGHGFLSPRTAAATAAEESSSRGEHVMGLSVKTSAMEADQQGLESKESHGITSPSPRNNLKSPSGGGGVTSSHKKGRRPSMALGSGSSGHRGRTGSISVSNKHHPSDSTRSSRRTTSSSSGLTPTHSVANLLAREEDKAARAREARKARKASIMAGGPTSPTMSQAGGSSRLTSPSPLGPAAGSLRERRVSVADSVMAMLAGPSHPSPAPSDEDQTDFLPAATPSPPLGRPGTASSSRASSRTGAGGGGDRASSASRERREHNYSLDSISAVTEAALAAAASAAGYIPSSARQGGGTHRPSSSPGSRRSHRESHRSSHHRPQASLGGAESDGSDERSVSATRRRSESTSAAEEEQSDRENMEVRTEDDDDENDRGHERAESPLRMAHYSDDEDESGEHSKQQTHLAASSQHKFSSRRSSRLEVTGGNSHRPGSARPSSRPPSSLLRPEEHERYLYASSPTHKDASSSASSSPRHAASSGRTHRSSASQGANAGGSSSRGSTRDSQRAALAGDLSSLDAELHASHSNVALLERKNKELLDKIRALDEERKQLGLAGAAPSSSSPPTHSVNGGGESEATSGGEETGTPRAKQRMQLQLQLHDTASLASGSHGGVGDDETSIAGGGGEEDDFLGDLSERERQLRKDDRAARIQHATQLERQRRELERERRRMEKENEKMDAKMRRLEQKKQDVQQALERLDQGGGGAATTGSAATDVREHQNVFHRVVMRSVGLQVGVPFTFTQQLGAVAAEQTQAQAPPVADEKEADSTSNLSGSNVTRPPSAMPPSVNAVAPSSFSVPAGSYPHPLLLQMQAIGLDLSLIQSYMANAYRLAQSQAHAQAQARARQSVAGGNGDDAHEGADPPTFLEGGPSPADAIHAERIYAMMRGGAAGLHSSRRAAARPPQSDMATAMDYHHQQQHPPQPHRQHPPSSLDAISNSLSLSASERDRLFSAELRRRRALEASMSVFARLQSRGATSEEATRHMRSIMQQQRSKEMEAVLRDLDLLKGGGGGTGAGGQLPMHAAAVRERSFSPTRPPPQQPVYAQRPPPSSQQHTLPLPATTGGMSMLRPSSALRTASGSGSGSTASSRPSTAKSFVTTAPSLSPTASDDANDADLLSGWDTRDQGQGGGGGGGGGGGAMGVLSRGLGLGLTATTAPRPSTASSTASGGGGGANGAAYPHVSHNSRRGSGAGSSRAGGSGSGSAANAERRAQLLTTVMGQQAGARR